VITETYDIGAGARIGGGGLPLLAGRLYFFGFFVRGLAVLAAAVALAGVAAVSDVPYTLARAAFTGFAAANMSANYGYFLHVIRHGRSWHLRAGLGRGMA
jgi:hypothetical protein